MANSVFANGQEISCKAAAGKTICAMPDVCFTPPENPATPPGVPVPYPNTGMASDTTDGSKKVKITKKEVGLKNKSSFKKSMGDEAGAAAKKGVITSKNTGKVFFESWSMDVKIEGKNAVRHLDMTTNNHASTPGDTPPWVYADRMAMAEGLEECDGDRENVKTKCNVDPSNPKDMAKSPDCPSTTEIKKAESARAKVKLSLKKTKGGKLTAASKRDPAYVKAKEAVNKKYEDLAKEIEKDECQKALRCFLSPQDPSRCCPGQSPHHLIPASAFVKKGTRGGNEKVLKSFKDYKSSKAPCICVSGRDAKTAKHKKAHNAWADYASSSNDKTMNCHYNDNSISANNSAITYEDPVEGAKKTAEKVAPNCDPLCIEAQVNQQHLGKKKPTKKQNETKIRKTMADDHLRSGAGAIG